ncbi:MAG: hypothetical protein GF353_09560, partial [Candidatus Lokiarchaeota archaeon]|nr:hypothetical protein [Candidatus Lokiarchaeota archaeon]
DAHISGNTQLTFALDESGVTHGSFYDSVNNRIAKSFDDILYSSAKMGGLKYIADGENPINCEPRTVIITVTHKNKPNINGNDPLHVKCKLNYHYYLQGDEPWKNDDYDKYIKEIVNNLPIYYKIKRKGCALTCMAMALKTMGVDYNPGTLNTWMKNNSGFYGSRVKWGSINSLSHNSNIIYHKFIGDGLAKDPTGKIISPTINLSSINNYLKKCWIVIAQVANPNSGYRNHWILVTEKVGNNYNILDPSYKNRKDLAAYTNKVYRFIIYKNIKQCN